MEEGGRKEFRKAKAQRRLMCDCHCTRSVGDPKNAKMGGGRKGDHGDGWVERRRREREHG